MNNEDENKFKPQSNLLEPRCTTDWKLNSSHEFTLKQIYAVVKLKFNENFNEQHKSRWTVRLENKKQTSAHRTMNPNLFMA